MLRIFKFIITQDDPIQIGTIIYSDCLAIVLAHDVAEARAVAKAFLAAHKDPYANRVIDAAWLDYVTPEEFSIDAPRCVGVTLG